MLLRFIAKVSQKPIGMLGAVMALISTKPNTLMTNVVDANALEGCFKGPTVVEK